MYQQGYEVIKEEVIYVCFLYIEFICSIFAAEEGKAGTI